MPLYKYPLWNNVLIDLAITQGSHILFLFLKLIFNTVIFSLFFKEKENLRDKTYDEFKWIEKPIYSHFEA